MNKRRQQRPETVTIWLVLLLTLLPASRARAAEKEPDAANALTFYHWLQSPSEARALTALTDLFKAQYPGVPVKALPTTRRESGALLTVEGRVGAGVAPDSV